MEREDHRCQGPQHGWATPLDSSKQACSVASTTQAQGRLDQTGECIENTWSDSVMDVMPFLQAIAQAETPPRAPVIPPQVSRSQKWNFLVTYPEEIP